MFSVNKTFSTLGAYMDNVWILQTFINWIIDSSVQKVFMREHYKYCEWRP